jgi:hypothetical protein
MSDCSERRKDGSPCRVRARPGRPFCAFHDPDLQEQREAARVSGGHGKRTAHRLDKLTPHSLRPVLATLFETLEGLKDGTVEPRQGTAMASVATAIVRLFEVSELEIRLRELEGQHEQRTG